MAGWILGHNHMHAHARAHTHKHTRTQKCVRALSTGYLSHAMKYLKSEMLKVEETFKAATFGVTHNTLEDKFISHTSCLHAQSQTQTPSPNHTHTYTHRNTGKSMTPSLYVSLRHIFHTQKAPNLRVLELPCTHHITKVVKRLSKIEG